MVQRPFDLPDGSRLNLTIANYYSPSGRSIQRPYRNDTIVQVDYKTRVLNRPVIGSGGVMPDLEITKEMCRDYSLVAELVNSHDYRIHLLNYVTEVRRGLLKQYHTSFERYNKEFMLDMLDGYDLGSWLSMQKKLTNKQKTILCQQTAMLVTRYTWGVEAYYKVMQTIDPYLLKSREVLRLN